MSLSFSSTASNDPTRVSGGISVSAKAETGRTFYVLAAVVSVALLLVSGDVLQVGEAIVVSFAVSLVAIAWSKVRLATERTQSAPPQRKDWDATSAAFAVMGDRMIAQAIQRDQPFSVVVFEQDDLAELRAIFGHAVAQKLVAQLAAKLQTVAPERGVVVRTDVAVFTLLLPGFTRATASAAIKKAFGSMVSVEVDAGEEGVVLMPDFLIRTLQDVSAPLAQVYDSMRRNIRRARTLEERRQKYLRAEHESHCTKPSPLMEDDGKYAAYVRHEKTIQMPLGLR